MGKFNKQDMSKDGKVRRDPATGEVRYMKPLPTTNKVSVDWLRKGGIFVVAESKDSLTAIRMNAQDEIVVITARIDKHGR